MIVEKQGVQVPVKRVKVKEEGPARKSTGCKKKKPLPVIL
jgi:hypothetical protein